MTSKEKAEELLHKMFNTGSALYADRIGAKQCALIAVDEIINALRYTDAKNDLGYIGYWNKVKQEIEKL